MEHVEMKNSWDSKVQIDFTYSVINFNTFRVMYLETSWAPVDELNGALGLDGGNSGVDILGDNITTVQHAACHVFTVTWITLNHLVSWLEASIGDLGNGELLVISLLSRDDWSISDQGEMDTGIWDQVSLELSQIDVESTIESEGSGDWWDNLTDQTWKSSF